MRNAASGLMELRDQHAAGEEVRRLKAELAQLMEVVAMMQGRTG